LETLKVFDNGNMRIEGRRPVDAQGNATGGLRLNEAIEKDMEKTV
jgi:hypothetical protein